MPYLSDEQIAEILTELGKIKRLATEQGKELALYKRLYMEERVLVADQAELLYQAGQEIQSLELPDNVLSSIRSLAVLGFASVDGFDRSDYLAVYEAHTS